MRTKNKIALIAAIFMVGCSLKLPVDIPTIEPAPVVEVKPVAVEQPKPALEPAPVRSMPPLPSLSAVTPAPSPPVVVFQDRSAIGRLDPPKKNTTQVTGSVKRSVKPSPPPIIRLSKVSAEAVAKPFDRKEAAEDILNQMHLAAMGFNVPRTVNLFDTFDVSLIIDLDSTPEEVAQALEKAGAAGDKVTAEIRVSRVMAAGIVTKGFDVENISSREQALWFDAPSEWKWRLTPRTTGEQSVNVSIHAKVMVGDVHVEKYIKTFERDITVDVTAEQSVMMFLSRHWQWLLSTLLIPFGLFFYNKLKRTNELAKDTQNLP